MGKKQNSQHNYASIVWGLLAILWGFTILFDFVPFGAGLIGTGLILLGVNAVRALKGTSIESDNTWFGILALVWGGLELARPILRRLSESTDWDWGIFAILLIVLGGIVLARKLPHMRDKNVKELR
jgi:hypothetical protein